MPIADFPTALQPIIQAGYLEHEFKTGLQATLAFRRCADRETVPVGIGQTMTSTRPALLPAVTTPINTAAVSTGVATTTSAYPNLQTAARLDNGLIPQAKAVEQYTIGIDKYAATLDLNTKTSRVGLARQFPLNARLLGEQAARSLDAIARNALYATYDTGNTFVRTAAGASTSIPVDDIRGFLLFAVNGVLTAVGGGNPLAVTIGTGVYSVTAVTPDGSNLSTIATFGGVSGVLTLAAATSSGDGAQYSPVVSAVAPSVLRPLARTTTQSLVSTDKLTMSVLLDAVSTLRSNGVQPIDGLYDCIVGPKSQRQLFADADFKQLFQGATSEAQAFAQGMLEAAFLGMRFVPSTEVPRTAHPTLAGVFIERPIVLGMGALVEGDYEGLTSPDDGGIKSDDEVVEQDGVLMITRPPMDRLNEVITQSWEWIGGFVAPTDMTTNPSVVGSSTNAAYKRAVVIEHVS